MVVPLISELDLCSPPGAELLGRVRQRTTPQLAEVAERCARPLVISSPFAPGFRCIGGEFVLDGAAAGISGAARLSVTGNGETLEAALISCLGEAADLLSQFERPDDIRATGPPQDFQHAIDRGWIADITLSARAPIDWMEAHDARTGAAILLPADLCLRRPVSRSAIEPAGPLSAGAAAGPDFQAAAVRAVLELCERDAAALWWLGASSPKSFPQDHAADKSAMALVERLRQGETSRRTFLLDVTTDLGVPVVAAVSTGPDSRDLAFGLAARLDPSAAASAAILEMCQMELAAPVAAAKRTQRGDAALNEADRKHLSRAALVATDCELLRPRGGSSLVPARPLGDGELGHLVGRLNEFGIGLFLLDLTRPEIGVATVRAVSPELQPFATSVTTERLARARRESGGTPMTPVSLF